MYATFVEDPFFHKAFPTIPTRIPHKSLFLYETHAVSNRNLYRPAGRENFHSLGIVLPYLSIDYNN